MEVFVDSGVDDYCKLEGMISKIVDEVEFMFKII